MSLMSLTASPLDELTRLVRTPPPARLPPALLFVGSFVLFLLAGDRDAPLQHLAIVAAVLFFHESGHALGMIALGYRDVRIFFIPFFGAATAGKSDGGPGWRHGVVLLLGPVPGIVAGGVLAVASGADPATTAGYGARMLVFINAFNLLPVVPLDGGRLLDLVLFGRHRIFELVFKFASVAAFALLALYERSVVLGVIACFQVMAVRGSWVVASAVSALRRSDVPLPPRVEEASEALVHDVDRERLHPKWGSGTAAQRATWIRFVIERAIDAQRAPGLLGSIGLLVAWVISVFMALVAIVLCVRAP